MVRRIGVSRKTIKKYLRLLEQLPLQMEGKVSANAADAAMSAIIYNNDLSPVKSKRYENLVTHFEYAKKELHKTGVLWLKPSH